MNIVEHVGHERHFGVYSFPMVNPCAGSNVLAGERRIGGAVDCEVSDALRFPVSQQFEILGAKVSYCVTLRVANYHTHQNQVDSNFENGRVIRLPQCGWGVTGRCLRGVARR